LRKYETIFVVDSLLKSEEIESIVSKYERFISANGGKIEDIEHWGKKRLAYEIKKRQYGYYVLIRFEGPPTMIKPLEREYRLNESLLRFKTLAMEKASIEAAERAAEDVAKTEEKVEAPAKEEAPTEPVAEETPADDETPVDVEAAEHVVEEAAEETPDVNEEEEKKEE
jgi:small subunit ribosomal protein S6